MGEITKKELVPELQLDIQKGKQAEQNTKDYIDQYFQKPKLTNDTVAKSVPNGNWNSITETGFYMAENALNQPVYSGAHTWWFGNHIKHSDDWCTQQLTDFNNRATFIRNKQNGSWGAWKLIVDHLGFDNLKTSVDNGKYGLRSAIIDKGGRVTGAHPNSFQELINGINSLDTQFKSASGNVNINVNTQRTFTIPTGVDFDPEIGGIMVLDMQYSGARITAGGFQGGVGAFSINITNGSTWALAVSNQNFRNRTSMEITVHRIGNVPISGTYDFMWWLLGV